MVDRHSIFIFQAGAIVFMIVPLCSRIEPKLSGRIIHTINRKNDDFFTVKITPIATPLVKAGAATETAMPSVAAATTTRPSAAAVAATPSPNKTATNELPELLATIQQHLPLQQQDSSETMSFDTARMNQENYKYYFKRRDVTMTPKQKLPPCATM